MKISEAVERACQEPSLIDALSWICDWEAERAIRQTYTDGKNWDNCFKLCIEKVVLEYKCENTIKLNIKDNETDIEMLEIFSVLSDGRKVLWAISHIDLIYESSNWKDRIREGETINVELIEINK